MAKKQTHDNQSLPFSYSGYDPLQPAGHPELVIGLIGPVGVDRTKVCNILESELKEYGYETKRIGISNLITELPAFKKVKENAKDESERIGSLMDAGDKLRDWSKHGDALAILAIAEIQRRRDDINKRDGKSEGEAREKTVYILDSLKHPEEVSTLRATYGRGFILISAYSRRSNRINHLAKKIAKSKHAPQGKASATPAAEELINRDEKEDHTKFGQNVQDCFHRADFFTDIDTSNINLKKQIDRYFQTIFDNPFITPSRDEWGMFHAEAASWRSADLARQVGASICNDNGDVLSLGCNEVPKAFGGLYWEGDSPDGRDFQRGHDEGAEHKRLALAEVFRRMSDSGEFDDKAKLKFKDLIDKSINGKEDPLLNGLQTLNVIEYGRTVHAEMAALMDATARGVSVKGATMYVNTFPCHICARHIISAGIERIVYVEPYPKSLSGDLFSDSISTDHEARDNSKVLFESFTGIAPRAYQNSFQAISKRKDKSGGITNWEKSKANTKLKRFVTSYLAIEHQIVAIMVPEILKSVEDRHNELSRNSKAD